MSDTGRQEHNVDGAMPVPVVDEYGGKRYHLTDAIELYYAEHEPDGELFAKGVTVHIEQMDDNQWWMSISDGTVRVHFDLGSKKPIRTLWRLEDA